MRRIIDRGASASSCRSRSTPSLDDAVAGRAGPTRREAVRNLPRRFRCRGGRIPENRPAPARRRSSCRPPRTRPSAGRSGPSRSPAASRLTYANIPGFRRASAVGDLDAYLGRPRLRVDDAADLGDLRDEVLVGIGGRRDVRPSGRRRYCDVALEDVGLHPDAREVGDRHQRRIVGPDELAVGDAALDDGAGDRACGSARAPAGGRLVVADGCRGRGPAGLPRSARPWLWPWPARSRPAAARCATRPGARRGPASSRRSSRRDRDPCGWRDARRRPRRRRGCSGRTAPRPSATVSPTLTARSCTWPDTGGRIRAIRSALNSTTPGGLDGVVRRAWPRASSIVDLLQLRPLRRQPHDARRCGAVGGRRGG